jgi:hypothetical protein
MLRAIDSKRPNTAEIVTKCCPNNAYSWGSGSRFHTLATRGPIASYRRPWAADSSVPVTIASKSANSANRQKLLTPNFACTPAGPPHASRVTAATARSAVVRPCSRDIFCEAKATHPRRSFGSFFQETRNEPPQKPAMARPGACSLLIRSAKEHRAGNAARSYRLRGGVEPIGGDE